MNEKVFDIKELAVFFNCSISKIRLMIRNHELPYFRIGMKYAFRMTEILKWIKENETR